MIVESNTENQINILLNEALKNKDYDINKNVAVNNVDTMNKHSNYDDIKNKIKASTQEIIKLFTESKSQKESNLSNVIEDIECAASYHLHYHQSKINSSRCLMNFSVSTMSNFVCLFIHLNNNMDMPKDVNITVYAKAILKKYVEFRKFIHYTLFHTAIPTSVTVMSLYFFYILRSRLPQYFNKLSSIYKVWLVCLLICNKVYLDNSYRNITWAKDLTELPIDEINYLETIVLKALNYNVWISAENFNFWVRQLEWYMDWLHFESISSTSIYPTYHSVKPSVPDIQEKDEISNQSNQNNISMNNINGTNSIISEQYDNVVIPASKVMQDYTNYQNNQLTNNTLQQQQQLLQQQRQQLQQQLHQQLNNYHTSTSTTNINNNNNDHVIDNRNEYYNSNIPTQNKFDNSNILDNNNEILRLINQLRINNPMQNNNDAGNNVNGTINQNSSLHQHLQQYKINPDLPNHIQIQELQKLLQQGQYQNYQQQQLQQQLQLQQQQIHQQQLQQQQLQQQQLQQQQLQQQQLQQQQLQQQQLQQQKLQQQQLQQQQLQQQQLQQQQKQLQQQLQQQLQKQLQEQFQQNYNKDNLDSNRISVPISNYYSNVSSLTSTTTSSYNSSTNAVSTIITTTATMMTTLTATVNEKVPIVPIGKDYIYPSNKTIDNFVNNDLIKTWNGMTLSNQSTQSLVHEVNGSSIIPPQTKPQVISSHEAVTNPIEAIGSNKNKGNENLHNNQNNPIYNLTNHINEDLASANYSNSNKENDTTTSIEDNKIELPKESHEETLSSTTKTGISGESKAIDIKKGAYINNNRFYYHHNQPSIEGEEYKNSLDNLSQISKKSIRNSCINSIKLSTSFRSNNNLEHRRTNTTNENVKQYMDKYYNRNKDSDINSGNTTPLKFEKEDISKNVKKVERQVSTLKDQIENSGILNKNKDSDKVTEKDNHSLISDSTINGVSEQLTESPKYSEELMKEINVIQKKYSTRNLHYLVSAARNASKEEYSNEDKTNDMNVDKHDVDSTVSKNNRDSMSIDLKEAKPHTIKTKENSNEVKKIASSSKDNKSLLDSNKFESPFTVNLHKPMPKPLDPVLPNSFKPLSLLFSKVKNNEPQLDSNVDDDDLLFDSEGNLIHKDNDKNAHSLFNDISDEDHDPLRIKDRPERKSTNKDEPPQSFKLENALETAFKKISTLKEDEVDENQSPNIKTYSMYFAPMNNFFDNLEFDSSLVTKLDKKYSKFSNKSRSISGGEMKYNHKVDKQELDELEKYIADRINFISPILSSKIDLSQKVNELMEKKQETKNHVDNNDSKEKMHQEKQKPISVQKANLSLSHTPNKISTKASNKTPSKAPKTRPFVVPKTKSINHDVLPDFKKPEIPKEILEKEKSSLSTGNLQNSTSDNKMKLDNDKNSLLNNNNDNNVFEEKKRPMKLTSIDSSSDLFKVTKQKIETQKNHSGDNSIINDTSSSKNEGQINHHDDNVSSNTVVLKSSLKRSSSTSKVSGLKSNLSFTDLSSSNGDSKQEFEKIPQTGNKDSENVIFNKNRSSSKSQSQLEKERKELIDLFNKPLDKSKSKVNSESFNPGKIHKSRTISLPPKPFLYNNSNTNTLNYSTVSEENSNFQENYGIQDQEMEDVYQKDKPSRNNSISMQNVFQNVIPSLYQFISKPKSFLPSISGKKKYSETEYQDDNIKEHPIGQNISYGIEIMNNDNYSNSNSRLLATNVATSQYNSNEGYSQNNIVHNTPENIGNVLNVKNYTSTDDLSSHSHSQYYGNINRSNSQKADIFYSLNRNKSTPSLSTLANSTNYKQNNNTSYYNSANLASLTPLDLDLPSASIQKSNTLPRNQTSNSTNYMTSSNYNSQSQLPSQQYPQSQTSTPKYYPSNQNQNQMTNQQILSPYTEMQSQQNSNKIQNRYLYQQVTPLTSLKINTNPSTLENVYATPVHTPTPSSTSSGNVYSKGNMMVSPHSKLNVNEPLAYQQQQNSQINSKVQIQTHINTNPFIKPNSATSTPTKANYINQLISHNRCRSLSNFEMSRIDNGIYIGNDKNYNTTSLNVTPISAVPSYDVKPPTLTSMNYVDNEERSIHYHPPVVMNGMNNNNNNNNGNANHIYNNANNSLNRYDTTNVNDMNDLQIICNK